ncbi:DEAD/DEAH box helicase [Ignisphaera sp. 4213-co]|uniref:DEAD/DEAH box helicase n=1 Tax=Ignisphaera cupida TaxID=3050454 RepID=A0ABD4Z4P9_9CREN|nr:DEAD/DEAH box helicase [Ignisphaera sp. 4213-co]MDK6027972.1 DEAD/DEAH box helicase [Ignisphaera sp. 4213-co]
MVLFKVSVTMKNSADDSSYWFAKLGFETLTNIQKISFPKVLEHDRDLIVIAPTGSGKTEAVMVPLLIKLTKNGFLKETPSILIIYITPLRALNRDIKNRLEKICSVFNCDVEVWHGDTSYAVRKRIVKKPPHILLTTPESFQILLIKKDLMNHMLNLYAVVIDELQELINDERGTELFLSLERLDEALQKHVRRIAISASMSEQNARVIGNIIFSNRSFDIALSDIEKVYDVKVVLTENSYQSGVFDVNKVVEKISEIASKWQHSQILLFTNTRTSAEELSFLLRTHKLLSEGDVGLHHGSLSKIEREYVERNFKEGSLKVVVSTSSLELGIDIGSVDLVLQYLSPRQVVKLMQRVGRAGHRETSISKGIVLVPPIITEIVESIVIAKRLQRKDLESEEMHFNSLDVLVHQLVGLTIERGLISIEEFFNIVKKSPLFNGITLEDVEKVASFLNEIGLIKCDDPSRGKCSDSKRGYIYYVTTNMIPDTSQYSAKSIIDHKIVASLDEDFIATCNENDVIVLAGKPWKIVSIDYDEKNVWLAPFTDLAEIVLPRWVGENIPVHRKVAREVCSFLRRFCTCDGLECVNMLLDNYNVDRDVKEFLILNKENICKVYPNDKVLTIELFRIPNEKKTLLAIYTCLGSKASEAFSIVVSKILRDYLKIGNVYRSHQLGTVVFADTDIDTNHIKNLITLLFNLNEKGLVRELIVEELKKTSIFRRNLINVARKMGVISKNSDLKEVKRIINNLMNIPILVDETIREMLVDKIDIQSVIEFIDTLSKDMKIRIIITRKPSPYLQEITQLGALRYIVRNAAMPKELLIELAKRRLLNRKIKAFCLVCGTTFELSINEYLSNVCKTENPFKCAVHCPSCGSKAVTVIDKDDDVAMLKKILLKVKSFGEIGKLNVEERTFLEKFAEAANIIMEYGLACLIALQGIGIGIENAKKVLSKSFDMNTLIQNILEYEEKYLKTRRYWE